MGIKGKGEGKKWGGREKLRGKRRKVVEISGKKGGWGKKGGGKWGIRDKKWRDEGKNR